MCEGDTGRVQTQRETVRLEAVEKHVCHAQRCDDIIAYRKNADVDVEACVPSAQTMRMHITKPSTNAREAKKVNNLLFDVRAHANEAWCGTHYKCGWLQLLMEGLKADRIKGLEFRM